MKILNILIKLSLLALVVVALYAPRPAGLPDTMKNLVFAGCSADGSMCDGDIVILDFNDGTLGVFEMGNCGGPGCQPNFLGYIDLCTTANCSGTDPSGNPIIWCTQPAADTCTTCEGGCSHWQNCSDNDCYPYGNQSRSECSCSWSGNNTDGFDLQSVSGQYCTDYCPGVGSYTDENTCNNIGNVCTFQDRRGQLNGACNGSWAYGYCGQKVCCTAPPAPPPAKTCAIDSVSADTIIQGQSVTANFSGNNNGNTAGSDTVRLWVEQWPTGTAISPAPATDVYTGNQTYYHLVDCTSTGSTSCSGSYTLSNLPTGTYRVHCDLPGDPNKCSGNPYCSQEGLGGTEACTGWTSCSNNDNKQITIQPPPVTVQSRAVVVGAGASCDDVRASTNGIDAAIHAFTVAPTPTPASQTQSAANYVTFTGTVAGTYTLSPTVPSDYVLRRACWQSTNPTGSGEGLSANTVADETLVWDVGYSAGTGWTQTKEGNVYGAGTVKNLVPSLASPRVFNLDSASLYPGVVTYGTDYDFAADTTKGASFVSSKNWLINQAHTSVDYYNLFYHRFGSPTAPDSFADLTNVTKPASRATPYYVVGDVTTSGDWSVGNGESIVFLVDGNLTISGNINITGTGFVAFIVKNNITISSSLGGLYSSSTPVVEGIYVSGGTFSTGTSSVVGKERLVGKGMFVANSFTLQRDLDSLGRNISTSAELFTYNPQLLFTMPDYMKDVPVTWQEVAP